MVVHWVLPEEGFHHFAVDLEVDDAVASIVRLVWEPVAHPDVHILIPPDQWSFLNDRVTGRIAYCCD